MFRVSQQFWSEDLSQEFELIDPGPDSWDVTALTGDYLVVLLPERRKLTCVYTIWGGGMPATDFLWDQGLNEGVRYRRCIVPATSVERQVRTGVLESVAPFGHFYAIAAVLAWMPDRATEICVAPMARYGGDDESILAPLALTPAYMQEWADGSATQNLLELLEGRPWTEELHWRLRSDWFGAPIARPSWEHVKVGLYPAERDLRHTPFAR